MEIHTVIWLAIAAVITAGVAWLFLGRRISIVVDACFPRRAATRSFEPMMIQFDPAGISSHWTLGSQGWSFSWPNAPGPFELKITIDGQCRLVLQADGRSFTFGPLQTRWNDPDKPTYQFVPEAGDVVCFTRTIGTLPWPTPFEFNWLGGASPKMKRFIYDCLTWTKASGARLKVLWRGQEFFYPGSGWADTWNNRLTYVVILDANGSR